MGVSALANVRLLLLQALPLVQLEISRHGSINEVATRNLVNVFCKIMVDIRRKNSFVVTLVRQLARLDHHFFLDFIFH